MGTMYSIVEKSCARFPERTALVYKDRSYTYSELWKEIQKIKSFFSENCNHQDIVSLYMENSDMWLFSYFGIMGAGCICNPIGLRTSDENVHYQLKFAQPKYLVISAKFKAKCERLELDKYVKVITFSDIVDKIPKKASEVKLADDDYVSLMYTSGTKGLQKAIRLRHGTVFNATKNIIEYLKVRSDEISYQILPLTHSFGLGNVHTTWYMGGKVVVADNTINYKKILREMVEHKVSFFAAVPITIKLIVENYFEEFKQADKYLRILCTNTGPMATEITHKIITECENVQFFTYYGLTEASRSSFMHYNLFSDKLESVGKPTPNVQIKLIDLDGKTVNENGKLGEIFLTGNHVVEEYWKNKEATDKAFKEGWLATGDIGYFDEEGLLFVIGRDDDIVNISGEKVSLQTVDNVIIKLNSVEDVMCLEAPNPTQEFEIHAHVVLNKEANDSTDQDNKKIKDDIIAHCKKHLDNFQVPKEIIFCDEIPRTDSGKARRGYFRNQKRD